MRPAPKPDAGKTFVKFERAKCSQKQELVKLVKGFESTISIEKEGKKVDCRKLLALMGLGVKKGHEVTFTIEGADEEAAYEAVSKFMQENL